jgi:hypothetical protein
LFAYLDANGRDSKAIWARCARRTSQTVPGPSSIAHCGALRRIIDIVLLSLLSIVGDAQGTASSFELFGYGTGAHECRPMPSELSSWQTFFSTTMRSRKRRAPHAVAAGAVCTSARARRRWLLEVNMSPAIAITTEEDYHAKWVRRAAATRLPHSLSSARCFRPC